MPSYAFWLLALVGIPVVYSSFQQYIYTYIFVLLILEFVLSCCSWDDQYDPPSYLAPLPAARSQPYTPVYKANYDPVYKANYDSYKANYAPYKANYDPVYKANYDPVYKSNNDPVYEANYPSFRRSVHKAINEPLYIAPLPINNTPTPAYYPTSSVFKQYSSDLKICCGEYLHEFVAEKSAERYQYDRELQLIPSRVMRNDTRLVLGHFTCQNPNCGRRRRFWDSGSICVQVLVTADDFYMTVIHSQQCNTCSHFVKPVIDDEVYARRIVEILDLWTGRRTRLGPNTDYVKTPPHDCTRCHGCQKGICPRRK